MNRATAPDDRVAARRRREAHVSDILQRRGHGLVVPRVQLVDADDGDVVQHVPHVPHHVLVGERSR